MSLIDRLKQQNGAGAPPQFGPPMGMPTQPQFGPPPGTMQLPAPQFGPPTGAPQGFGPPPGQQFAPPAPQQSPEMRSQIAALEAEEQRLKGAPPAYAQQPQYAPQMQPAPQPQWTPPAQQQPAPWQAPAPQGAPQTPWTAPPTGAPQPAPQQMQPAPQCQACGVMLDPSNASRMHDGSIRHIACPRMPAQVLPPDAPPSQPHLAANPIAPESMYAMPASIQQAAQNFTGMVPLQPSQPTQWGQPPAPAPQQYQPQIGMPQQAPLQPFIAPPKGEKCRASRVQIQISQEQSQRRAMLCPGGCGQTIQLKPEQISGLWVAKIKTHHLELAPGQGAATGQMPQQGGAMPPQHEAPTGFMGQPGPASPGLTLYLDVALQGIQATDLEQYVSNCCNTLAQQFNAADIRCAPAESPLGYGKWKGALAAVVRSYPPDGACVLNGIAQSEIKQVVVEALRPMCKAIITSQR